MILFVIKKTCPYRWHPGDYPGDFVGLIDTISNKNYLIQTLNASDNY